MIAIDEAYVDAAAPNADAAKNGRGLVLKNKFADLHISEDGSAPLRRVSGQRQEAVPLFVRLRPAGPAHPPLHLPEPAVPVQALPRPDVRLCPEEDVHDGRGAGRRAGQAREARRPVEKKAAEAEKPKQVNQAALAKKIKAQLDGIDVLERLTHDLVRLGIGNMNAKLAAEMEKQAKQLGDAYLPGARPPCTLHATLRRRRGQIRREIRPRTRPYRGARPAHAACTPSSSRVGHT